MTFSYCTQSLRDFTETIHGFIKKSPTYKYVGLPLPLPCPSQSSECQGCLCKKLASMGPLCINFYRIKSQRISSMRLKIKFYNWFQLLILFQFIITELLLLYSAVFSCISCVVSALLLIFWCCDDGYVLPPIQLLTRVGLLVPCIQTKVRPPSGLKFGWFATAHHQRLLQRFLSFYLYN